MFHGLIKKVLKAIVIFIFVCNRCLYWSKASLWKWIDYTHTQPPPLHYHKGHVVLYSCTVVLHKEAQDIPLAG